MQKITTQICAKNNKSPQKKKKRIVIADNVASLLLAARFKLTEALKLELRN
jgi:hypothetical protein